MTAHAVRVDVAEPTAAVTDVQAFFGARCCIVARQACYHLDLVGHTLNPGVGSEVAKRIINTVNVCCRG